jgi:tRNA A-37 threonylcarbamoyl transferase component Bud32
VPLQITGHDDGRLLLDLPWSTPLEEWPAEQLVALPRGVSRHVVRFVRVRSRVYAVKEVGEHSARKEYRLLRDLERLDVPAVEPVAIITGRTTPDGSEQLEPALVTRHLQFSLPYRALFSQTLRPDTAVRLLDALSVLLARLHSEGFYWGDCSLSNTLFRRDAGAFAAYLVDAETGELHPRLSEGQRGYDLEIAHGNIIGELMDLQAAGLLDEALDPIETGDDVRARYDALWSELTREEVVGQDERHRIAARVRRLNQLGFDVEELQMHALDGRVIIQPKVVDAGHHSRRLMRLTGLDVEENQARRLLNDLDAYRAGTGQQDEDEALVAHEWLVEVFQPVVRAVPRDQRGKLEPAEVFHEVLEHRWFMSERAGRDVGILDAARDYVRKVLVNKPDEKAVLGAAAFLTAP